MVADLAVTIMKRVPLAAYCRAVEMMAQTDFADYVPRISCPSLVIAGSADPVASVAACEAVRAALDGVGSAAGPMAVIDGAGHYACMDNPAAFNAALTGFFDGIRENARQP
ncbi:MAG: alpha/beta hydrolase [Alphaproteobacteria bacterium]